MDSYLRLLISSDKKLLKILPKLVRLKPQQKKPRQSWFINGNAQQLRDLKAQEKKTKNLNLNNSNPQILCVLPKLVKRKPKRKELKLSRSSKMYSSTKDINIINTLKQKILQVSNIASLLCAIDCTILPVITLILPLIGIGASSEQEEWMHHMGHKVAMYFVLPVGGLAAVMNYTSHKKISLTLVSFLALFLIFAVNASCDSPILSILPHEIVHLLHDGVAHRCVNIFGCGLLLALNYYGSTDVCNDICCLFGRRRKIHGDRERMSGGK